MLFANNHQEVLDTLCEEMGNAYQQKVCKATIFRFANLKNLQRIAYGVIPCLRTAQWLQDLEFIHTDFVGVETYPLESGNYAIRIAVDSTGTVYVLSLSKIGDPEGLPVWNDDEFKQIVQKKLGNCVFKNGYNKLV